MTSESERRAAAVGLTGLVVALVAVATTSMAARAWICAAAALSVAISAGLAGRIRGRAALAATCSGGALLALGIATSQIHRFATTIVGGVLVLLGISAWILAASLVQDRRGVSMRLVTRDVTVLGLAAVIVVWIRAIEPVLRRHSLQPAVAILHGIYHPLMLVLLVQFALIGIAAAHPPTGLKILAVVGVLGVISFSLGLGSDLSATAMLATRSSAGLFVVWCSLAVTVIIQPPLGAFPPPPAHEPRLRAIRLMTNTVSLIVPMSVLAWTAPRGTVDSIVRTVSSAMLIGMVTWTLVYTVRSNSVVSAQLLRSTQSDPLTDLPNRSFLIEQINGCLEGAWRGTSQPTLYFIDLDRFKNVNDSFGYAAGDELLKMVAQRLRTIIPDLATVARMSSDEYVVLDPGITSAATALELGELLLNAFREPLALSVGDVFVSASIGVASLQAGSSSSAEDLLRHADTAMYRAKDSGRNCIAIYDESMHERVAHRLQVETALYRALDRRELRMFHQPILDLEFGDVVGFEALMRWQRADGTIVPPAEFIPIAEDTGTIVPIGSWALLEALTQLRAWIEEGVCSSTATMSVNVSPRQLADPNFPAIVSEALTRSGVSPQLLWLEITESIMITEPDLALATLKRLRSLGVRVALDDFGTGYSSLSLLQRFPLQRLKIDRAFVQGVADNPNDRSLVRTIVAMGRSLGLDMVAEGVESVHQLQVLSDLGCSKAQGYLISHPVPAEAMRSTVAALERLGQFPGLRRGVQPSPSALGEGPQRITTQP